GGYRTPSVQRQKGRSHKRAWSCAERCCFAGSWSCAGCWCCAGGWGAGCWSGARCWSCAGSGGGCSDYPEPQWQGLQHHGQSDHCARRYRDPCEDRKTGTRYQLDRNGQRLMGRVRAAGFRHRDLREAAGQPRRPAQGDRDFVFQGSGCRLGETGNPDRPQGRWQGSVWPVGHSNQHYGKPISKTGASRRSGSDWLGRLQNGGEKDRTSVLYNERITIKDIPLAAYEYVVNGKPAIEWVMEREAESTHDA